MFRKTKSTALETTGVALDNADLDLNNTLTSTFPVDFADATPIAESVVPTAAPSAAKTASSGWLRVVKGNKALTIVGAVALLSLGFGLGASGILANPAGAALEEAPEPGLITVPVEFGSLNNDVTIRADIGFADATDVTLNTASIQGPAIVTGAIPEAGFELNPLSVALEITGRPVIVLPGELPAYRTLTVGMSGPDVVQFKQAMQAVGINAGDPNNDVFDATAANAVRELYARVGYPVPNTEDETTLPIEQLQEAVSRAERALQDARDAAEASRYAGADALVTECSAASTNNNPPSGWAWADLVRYGGWNRELLIDACASAGIGDAEGRVNAALTAGAPTQAAQDAVVDAQFRLDDARESLANANSAGLPQLPVSEVLFLNNLPRRVDSVSVTRGDALTGVSMRVSGAVLQLSGSATEANARLLEEGTEAFFDLPDGGTHRAVISTVSAPTDGGSRWSIEFTPDPLSPEQFARLQGSNVRVQIPVGATQGDVLFVPVAALTAGPGGEARLEVVDGDPRDGANALTRLVVVETGLSADGFVEVTPVGGEALAEGDLVVVGR